ncbi:MAG TPA: FecR domain-containing protein, partial [Parapedobacter sp.]|nr:FecR domain-containing protein [Parapedobacter sp.]
AVSEDKQRPFRVQTDAQQVEVLGTEFDISAYADDKETRTTLVTGSVRLSQAANELVLMPGEQGKLRNSIFTKKQVDVNAYIAWTHGDMVFDQTDLSQIFRQLERWYDVNFIFDNIRPEGQLYGKLSRQTNLSDVLRVIGRNTGLRFKITENQKGERRVRVYK